MVVFCEGANLSRIEKWTSGGEEMEIVTSLKYLLILSSGVTFQKARSTLAGKTLKAMNRHNR